MTPNQKSTQTHAEQIRSQRQVQDKPKKTYKKQPKTPANPSKQPRITSRVLQNEYASSNRTQSNAKRRKVYVPLKTPGAEIGLPSLPNIELGWRLASFLLFVVCLAALIGMKSMDIFRITQVNLANANRVPSDEVLPRLNLENLTIVDIIPSEIEAQVLTAFPDFQRAKVEVGLPAALTLTVEERVPAIIWIIDDGRAMWIDEDGYMFDVRGEATLPIKVYANVSPPPAMVAITPENDEETTLVSTTGFAPSTVQADPKLVSAILNLKPLIEEGIDLLYNPEYGLGWQDPRGWKVYFGTNVENIDQKLAQYSVIIEAITARKVQPTLISLEFLHAPFYRLEN